MSLRQLKVRSKRSRVGKARSLGIRRSKTMRKDQLVRGLAGLRNGRRRVAAMRQRRRLRKTKSTASLRARNAKPAGSARANHRHTHNGSFRKPLTLGRSNGHAKDRVVLLVRDPFWLHAYWDITLASVQRAEAALREEWYGAKPILRIFDVSSEDTTSSSETQIRDIEIHGNVNNWYIDVTNPPRSYRVDIGYLSRRGRFYAIAHSNVVSTPRAGTGGAIDENWASVQEQFDRTVTSAGGANAAACASDMKLGFDDRLRRPVTAPPILSFGLGALPAPKRRSFWFELDAELIVYGSTVPASRVSLQGEPIQLRPDGTFTMRFRLPDKRLIIPATCSSPEGSEERTIVLAVERNTKELEPVVHEAKED